MSPQRHIVCPVSELLPGQRKIVQVGRKSIGVFNVGGEFYALLNHCPHQHAPLCLGPLTGTTEIGEDGRISHAREGEIIRCPWHGWEFDIKSGRSIFNPHRVRTASYAVKVAPLCGGDAMTPPGSEDSDPGVETFPVSVEDAYVILILRREGNQDR